MDKQRRRRSNYHTAAVKHLSNYYLYLCIKFYLHIKFFGGNFQKKIYWSFFYLADGESLENAIIQISKKHKKKVDCLVNCASNSKRGEFYKYNTNNIPKLFKAG